MYKRFFKRLFDILFALTVLILTFPMMAVIALMVRRQMGSPVLFCQKRPGYRGKIFAMYKFRTMTNQRDSEGNLLPDEKRLTSLGKFLRKTSLDEFPEFLNVLKGDMSVIGPRPLLVQYLPLYSSEQARRHDVRPGVTGWAQVNGRNAISWQEKFRLDVWYVDHLSAFLDFKIFLLTIWKVFAKEGISAENCATAPPFMGNDLEDSPGKVQERKE